MKIIIPLIAIAFGLTACGGGATNTANNSNSKSSNSSPSPSPSATAAEVLEPTTLSAYDMMDNYRPADEGRIVTVTGGQLEAIEYGSLRISTISGSFSCDGDFTDYQSMKTRIDDLRYKHQSPTVTVKGIYTKSSYSSDRAAVKNCVLTDLKR